MTAHQYDSTLWGRISLEIPDCDKYVKPICTRTWYVTKLIFSNNEKIMSITVDYTNMDKGIMASSYKCGDAFGKGVFGDSEYLLQIIEILNRDFLL